MSDDPRTFCKDGCTLMHAHDVCRVPVIPADKLSDFWKQVYPDGLDIQDVLNELHDLEMCAEHVPKVYDHVTGGKVSKANTDASVVKALHDDYVNELIEEAVEEALEDRDDE